MGLRAPAVGPLYRARTVLSVVLLAFLLLAPFVTIDGQPLMLLNVLERRFVLLGVVFPPQDFYLVVLLALTALVTLVLVDGRRRPDLVRLAVPADHLHGDGVPPTRVPRSTARPSSSCAGIAAPGPPRAVAHVLKQAIFFALSFVIANVFLAWVIGAGRVVARSSPTRPRSIPPGSPRSRSSASSSTWCSRGSASRPACSPAPTAG